MKSTFFQSLKFHLAISLAFSGLICTTRAEAVNLLINGDFESPALSPGGYVTHAAINAYHWQNEATNITDNYLCRFGVGGTTDNYALLGGGSKGALGLTQIVNAVSSTTQTTHYTFSVDIWGSNEGGANGVYGGNQIILEYSGGGLGTNGSKFIYVLSANKVGYDGTGNDLISKANDNFNLISNLKNEIVTADSPESNFNDTFSSNQWNVLTLSWDLAANHILDGTSRLKVYLRRPTGTYEGSSNWTAYDNVILTASFNAYGSWAATNASGQAADLDYDNDGVANGVEYFMNAAPGFTAAPALVGNTVTWPNGGNIPSSAYGTVFVVQTSTDLVNWTDVPGTDPNMVNTSGSVTHTLSGTGKQFVRLKITPN
jgi:hypothetical protein